MRYAFSRFFLFLRVLRWLFGYAFKTSRRAVFGSVILVALSIALQLVAVMLSVSIIGKLAPGTTPGLASTENDNAFYGFALQYAEHLSNEMTIALVATFFIASAVFLYFSRILTLHVESSVIQGAEGQGIRGFARMSAMPEQLPDVGSSARLIALGSRSGGRVVRLVLRSAAEFGYLCAGLFILFLVSPWVFLVLAILVCAGLALNYPISLASYKTAKAFEVGSMKRRQALRQTLQTIQKVPTETYDLDVIPESRSFLAILRRRLAILEVARLAFGLFFVIALTTLLFLVSSGRLSQFVSLANLFLFVVVFRYIFTGYQGLMVLITTTNRFIPNAVRLHTMVTQLVIPRDSSQVEAEDDDE